MNKIKYPNKESYKEGELLGEHEQIKYPNKESYKMGVGLLREQE
jgi:hypothetical protein